MGIMQSGHAKVIVRNISACFNTWPPYLRWYGSIKIYGRNESRAREKLAQFPPLCYYIRGYVWNYIHMGIQISTVCHIIHIVYVIFFKYLVTYLCTIRHVLYLSLYNIIRSILLQENNNLYIINLYT